MTRAKATIVEQSVEVEVNAESVNGAAEQPAAPDVTSFAELQSALEGDDRPVERVSVPEWPGRPVFYLRGLTGHDRDTIENTTFGEGINDISAKIVARALCKPDGTALVGKGQMAEVERMLTSRTAGGLLRLQRVAKRLSRLDSAALEELEELLKAAPSGNNGSD